MLEKWPFEFILKKLKNGEDAKGFGSQGYKLIDNKEHVNMIVEGLKAKDGYCPCKVGKEPQNICPCDDFINTGKCCCKLWVER